MLVISFIIMSALRPTVDRLEKLKFPRPIAALAVYLLMILGIIFFGSVVIPPLVFETSRLISRAPYFLKDALNYIDPNIARGLSEQITPFGTNILKITLGFFTNILGLLTILVITFYLLIERKYLLPLLEAIMEEKTASHAFKIVEKVEERLGAWVRGQIALGTIVGLLTLAGLLFLNVPYALPLALIAALLEIIPNIGPIISTIPAALVALAISPLLALATIALFFLVQQVENNIIVPKVMQKAVGLNPLITIIALLIGAKLMGVLGAVLAVPTFLIFQTTLKEVIKK